MNKKELEKLGIEAVTMGVREQMMQYFKGTCVRELVSGVSVRSSYVQSAGGYYASRRQRANEQVCKIMLQAPDREIRLLTLKKAPERVILQDSILDRSPQMLLIKKGIQESLKTYLRGIKVEHSEKQWEGEQLDDREVVSFRPPQENQDPRMGSRISMADYINYYQVPPSPYMAYAMTTSATVTPRPIEMTQEQQLEYEARQEAMNEQLREYHDEMTQQMRESGLTASTSEGGFPF